VTRECVAQCSLVPVLESWGPFRRWLTAWVHFWDSCLGKKRAGAGADHTPRSAWLRGARPVQRGSYSTAETEIRVTSHAGGAAACAGREAARFHGVASSLCRYRLPNEYIGK